MAYWKMAFTGLEKVHYGNTIGNIFFVEPSLKFSISAYTFDGLCYLHNTIRVFDPKSSRFEMELAFYWLFYYNAIFQFGQDFRILVW